MSQDEPEIQNLRLPSLPGLVGPLPDGQEPEWLARIDPKYRPVWVGRSLHDQLALRLYFLPHRTNKPLWEPTRPRLIKWYCPFAPQSSFPTGHRYCINVYSGCLHGCRYCYAVGYEPPQPAAKCDYARLLAKDLEDLERFDVPPAPVHLSNSTDPFQPLEEQMGHTKLALEGMLAHRWRFTSVTLLTKNPSLAAREDYVQLLRALGEVPESHPTAAYWKGSGQSAVQVEVSLAFWRDQSCAFWDPCAPSVPHRIEGIQALRAVGIPVVLRIDPLFPRSPLPPQFAHKMEDFGLAEAQTLEDLENLVSFAKEMGVRHVVYSPARIVLPRRRPMDPAMQNLLRVYQLLSAPAKPLWGHGCWRLAHSLAARWLTNPFLEICQRLGVPAKFCMTNLIETF
jgi:DNA repair photolyase